MDKPQPAFSFAGPVSAKNQVGLKEKSISSSRSQRGDELSARRGTVTPLSAFNVCRGARYLNERPRYEDCRQVPRYRHHRVGIYIVVLEMAPNQGAGKSAGRDS